jgi:16S rRNA (adenine1518-N6/adenine1519-N6)-dimethyltransferase
VTITRRQLEQVLAAHGLGPSRALGQNFVVDPNTVRRIARIADVGPGDRVVEVGAGLGSLTLALAETGASVTAIEVDRHLLPALDEVLETAGPSRPPVRVMEADALELDWSATLEQAAGRSWTMVANLPYNVGTTIVLRALEEAPQIGRYLVMVQREVGERLAAEPATPAYGIPSVLVAYRADARLVGSVPPTVFFPRPKVDSVLVELVRRPAVATDADEALLWELVRAGFGQRRKMLRRSLAHHVEPDDFAVAGIDPRERPERLDIGTWGRLAHAVTQRRTR